MLVISAGVKLEVSISIPHWITTPYIFGTFTHSNSILDASAKPNCNTSLDEIDSVRRNPVIADLFHRMKFMERRGSGIKKILDETAKLPGYTEELKPTFHSTHSSFFVTLKNMNYSSPSLSDQDTDQDTDQVVTKMILEFCVEPRSKREICDHLGFNNLTYFTRTYLNPLLETEKLLRTIPDKPSSKNQKYVRP